MKEVFFSKIVSKTKQLFIGDICYALDETIYDSVWGEQQHYADGVVKDDKNVYSLVVRTKHGDGLYLGVGDTNGKYIRTAFPVDAGVLGAVNMDFLREDCSLFGRVVRLPQEEAFVEVRYEDGVVAVLVALDENFNNIISCVAIDTNQSI